MGDEFDPKGRDHCSHLYFRCTFHVYDRRKPTLFEGTCANMWIFTLDPIIEIFEKTDRVLEAWRIRIAV